MDQRCPHRCASLFLGRNEPGGLRCIYHGWKFDVDGNCLEMPNVAPAQRFEDKVKAKAYKVNERGGLIWVYMGARAEAPPMPMIEATMLPEAELNAQFVLRECNWMQALEGDIDTSHFSFLHIGSVTADQVPEDSMLKYQVACRSPEYHVADTEWGTMYAAYRPTEDERIYWRFAQFGFPFWAQVPQGNFIDRVSARAWVPMDDNHTMSVTLNWTKMSRATSSAEGRQADSRRDSRSSTCCPMRTEWYGRFRPKANDRNNYFIDREAQRNGTIYSGITHIHMQDQAVTESMGPITDHDFEHLAPSDQMIARTRRRLVHAARALREKGTVPPAVDNPEVFLRARAASAWWRPPTGARPMPRSCRRSSARSTRSRRSNSATASKRACSLSPQCGESVRGERAIDATPALHGHDRIIRGNDNGEDRIGHGHVAWAAAVDSAGAVGRARQSRSRQSGALVPRHSPTSSTRWRRCVRPRSSTRNPSSPSASRATPAAARRSQAMAATFEKVNPDVVVIVGNDQQEVFCDKNMPAFSIYWGESVTNRPPTDSADGEDAAGLLARNLRPPPGERDALSLRAGSRPHIIRK